MRRFIFPILFVLILILTACAPSQTNTNQSTPQPASVSTESSSSGNTSNDLTRSDQQGMVTVEVTPLNLDNVSDSLEFEVALNTHSVDLSMNIATLATLTTDTGMTVQATTWDAPAGGHHVSGKLIFPATKDGKSILEGAKKLTLTITNVDVPTRAFEWVLN